MTRPIAGSPLPNAASPLIRLLKSAQDWFTGDSSGQPLTGIDTTAEPWLYTSIFNRGKIADTASSAGASRPCVGNIESNGNLVRVMSFPGPAQYLTPSGALALRRYLHDGTGCTIFFCGMVTAYNPGAMLIIDDARGASLGRTGIDLGLTTTGALSYTVGNGAILNVNFLSAAGAVPTNVPFIVAITFGTAAGYVVRLNGIQIGAGATVGVPAAGNAFAAFELGTNGNVDVTSGWRGPYCEYVSFNSILSIQQIAFIENQFTQKYCRPSAPMRQAPTVWLSPALPNAARLDTAAAPTAVDRVWDASGKAHDAIQTTNNKEALLVTLSGQKAVSLDGVNDNYAVSTGVGWSANTAHTFMTVMDPTSPQLSGASDSYFFDAQTGRLALFVEQGSSAGGAGIERTGTFDTAYQIIARAVPGLQLLEWQTSTSDAMYRNGVLIGTRAATVARAIGGNVTIGSLNNSAAGFSQESIGDFFHRDVQLTGTGLWEVREKFFAQYVGLIWNSALVPDHVSILDPRVSDSVTTAGGAVSRVNSQHANIDTIADGSTQATGTTSWGTVAGAVLSKQNAAPMTGLCLRVATLGGVATQACLVAGQTFRIRGFARGDGAGSVPTFGNNIGGASAYWIGTNSTNWQPFDVTVTAAAGVTTLWMSCNIAGAYTEWTQLSVTNVTAGAGVQPTAGNRPTHDAINGRLQFSEASTQYLIESNPPAVAGGCCYYAWVNLAAPSVADSRSLWGVTDGVQQVQLYQLITTGAIQSVVAGANVINPDVVPSGLVFIAQMYGTNFHQVAIDAQIKQGSGAVTVPALSMFLGARNNSGAGAVRPSTDDIYYRGVIARVPSVRELMRIREQTRPVGGTPLPAAMTPADWNSQLCGCADLTVTTPGGPVSAWSDRLNRAGMGATSPGAASTFPQHSVVDNSVTFDGVDDGMQWVVPPNLNQGSIELWFYLPSIPGGTVYLCGTFVTGGQTLAIGVTAGSVFLRAGLSADPVLLGPTVAVGWHHCVATFTNGGARVLTADGITSVSTCNSAVPNQNLELGGLLLDGVPSLRTNCRIAKASIKSSVISVAQAVQNFVTDWNAIVNKEGV